MWKNFWDILKIVRVIQELRQKIAQIESTSLRVLTPVLGVGSHWNPPYTCCFMFMTRKWRNFSKISKNTRFIHDICDGGRHFGNTWFWRFLEFQQAYCPKTSYTSSQQKYEYIYPYIILNFKLHPPKTLQKPVTTPSGEGGGGAIFCEFLSKLI